MEETIKEYELLCILSPKLEEADLDKTKNNISATVAKCEGTISFKESSKRPLAYPINKEKQGIYLVSQISVFPEKIIELSNDLKTNKQILRHLISQLSGREESEKITTIKKPIRPKKTTFLKKEQPEKEKPSGETLQEIDKKLDEIIGEI